MYKHIFFFMKSILTKTEDVYFIVHMYKFVFIQGSKGGPLILKQQFSMACTLHSFSFSPISL